MTDRVYPSSKPNGTAGTTTGAAATTTKNPKLPPPPMKSQLYNNNRHPHRPIQAIHHRNRRRGGVRRCFCICCFWSILAIILLLLLATISGCVLYLLYHPRRPTFSITSLKIHQFNLTTAGDDTTRLTSNLDLTISTKNPNKKITFHYDPIAITLLTDQTQIANGSFTNQFTSNPNNITIIRSSLKSNSLLLESETVNQIRSDLKKKSGLRLEILLDTEAMVKIESIKSKKVGIRIKCRGIRSLIPKNGGGKAKSSSSSSTAAAVSDAKCEVDLRIKIWKFTF